MYYVFAWDTYYPGGGLNDYVASYEDIDDAEAYGKRLKHKDMVQIVKVSGSRLVEVTSFRPSDYPDEEEQENA